MSEEHILERLSKAVIDGDEEAAKRVAQEAVESGIDYLVAIKQGIGKALEEVGEAFEEFRIFLPQLMKAGDAGKAALAILKSLIPKEKLEEVSAGKVVIGTVYGDAHDIGKNVVASLLTAAGFEVYDLDVDVPPQNFVDKAEEVDADIIALVFNLVSRLRELQLFTGVAKSSRAPFEDLHIVRGK